MVTIILPTYNREKYLMRSMTSVVNQTYPEWELLVIDDGSTDKTAEAVQKTKTDSGQIKYFKKENGGVVSAMNMGIERAKGDFITFIGSDDEYEENHLELRVKYFSEHPEIDLIHSPAKIIGDEFVKDKNDLSKKIHLDNCILGGTLFGKAEVFKTLKGFANLPYSAESDFVERAEQLYRVEKFNRRTYIYHRDTPDSICNTV